MEYHRVRSSVPEFAPVALEDARRHQDGVSCKRPAAYRYDANGHKRWCIDCDAPLGEEAAWHPNGADPPFWLLGLALVVFCLFVLLALLSVSSGNPGTRSPGPVSTPTTYGPPPPANLGQE